MNTQSDVIIPRSLPNIYYPGAIFRIVVNAAILTALAPDNQFVTSETRQMALEAAETINFIESQKNGHTEEAILNCQMEAMTVALIDTDPGLRDVDIQQLILGTDELNGSTQLLESRLETIINKVRGEENA